MPSLCHYPFTPAHQGEDKAEKIGEPKLHSSVEAILDRSYIYYKLFPYGHRSCIKINVEIKGFFLKKFGVKIKSLKKTPHLLIR